MGPVARWQFFRVGQIIIFLYYYFWKPPPPKKVVPYRNTFNAEVNVFSPRHVFSTGLTPFDAQWVDFKNGANYFRNFFLPTGMMMFFGRLYKIIGMGSTNPPFVVGITRAYVPASFVQASTPALVMPTTPGGFSDPTGLRPVGLPHSHIVL